MTKLKILLLQARRADDPARIDEQRSFARQAGLGPDQLVPLNLLQGVPSLAEVRRYDALMIGGSGDYYVSKGNLPHFRAVLALLNEVVALGQPTFASCFGFHLLVQALGGQIVYDPDNMEVGTFQLQLTEAGRADELFSHLPGTFMAQLGHKDRASLMPPRVQNLAASRLAPYQALRVPGQPIWATQFHPELTREENLRRFKQYMAGYQGVMTPEAIHETQARFRASPEADRLVRAFLQLVFD